MILSLISSSQRQGKESRIWILSALIYREPEKEYSTHCLARSPTDFSKVMSGEKGGQKCVCVSLVNPDENVQVNPKSLSAL